MPVRAFHSQRWEIYDVLWQTKKSSASSSSTRWSVYPRDAPTQSWAEHFAGRAIVKTLAGPSARTVGGKDPGEEFIRLAYLTGLISMITDTRTTPVKLDLKRDEKLEIQWKDGITCTYTISMLRLNCPCAACKTVRQEKPVKKPLLNILPGNWSDPLSALSAELIGNYAIKIEWSDNHGSGIYSFQYLREICPPT